MTTLLWRVVRWLSLADFQPRPVRFCALAPPTAPPPPSLTREQRIAEITRKRGDGMAACEGLPDDLRENAMGLVEMEYRKELREVLHE